MELLAFFEKWIWLGCAGIGFGILFNVPERTLKVIFVMATLGGALKILIMYLGGGVIFASFLGAMLIGFMSIYAAHLRHSPPFVLAIPAVIPMVPGTLTYRTMLGVIRLTGELDHDVFLELMHNTVDNGLKAFFVLLALSLGVSMPMLLTRSESVKRMKIKMPIHIDGLIKNK
ncbi:MAG: threonine/serine exporter family protein [Mangrovibacterium sp.]|jgi:uncharacterized membrane protein YjjB (DUF3815 family)